mgnify:FL=1
MGGFGSPTWSFFVMKMFIVLLYIANGEPAKIADVYPTAPGAYQVCKETAKQLNIDVKGGRWDCSIKRGKDIK